MTPAEMREMAAKVCCDLANRTREGLSSPFPTMRTIASLIINTYENVERTIRAIPIPDTTAADDAPVIEPYQIRAKEWLHACFTPDICADKIERNHRFLEEALELVQSTGCTKSEAHQLVDYVYGRPVGEIGQEIGGVMNTLAALCLAHGFDMAAEGDRELVRCWSKIDKIRAKQAAKPKHSPLPAAPAADDALRPIRETNEIGVAMVDATTRDALEKAREALTPFFFGDPDIKSLVRDVMGLHVSDFRRVAEALAAIDAAKAKGNADEPPAEKWDARKAPCPTCGFHIQTLKSPPFEYGD